MYNQFEPYFESLSDLMTNDVIFPSDETEYEVNLANAQGGPVEANKGGSTPQPHAPSITPTPGPGRATGGGGGQNSQSSIVATLESSRQLVIELLIENNAFADCNTTALLSFSRIHSDI